RVDLAPGPVGARAVARVAVEHGAPVDDAQGPGGDLDLARRGVRQRAVGAGGDDRRKGDRLGAHAAHRELDVEGDVALGPAREPAGQHLGERLVGELRGGADAVELLGVLDDAQALDRAAGADELDAVAREPPELGVVAHAQVRVVEAEAHLALVGELLGDALEQVRGDLARPRLVELLGGLREVAEVGDEAPRPVDAHDRRAARAGEPGQPAHVREVGDQQRVEIALAQHLGEAVGAGRGLVRRGAHAWNSSLRRDNASRYPSTPWPLIVATQSSRTTDTRRNSSRCITSERWTSTAGSAAISSASWIAHE